MNKLILILASGGFYTGLFAQCKVTDELNANGTLVKTTNAEVIYYNPKAATMYSSVKHDGQDYYFAWSIKPFDKKKVKSESMYIRLKNDSLVVLDFYDSYKKDSTIHMLYRISKKNFEQLMGSDIKEIKMVVDGVQKRYVLVRHKALLRTQLQCIQDAQKKKKK